MSGQNLGKGRPTNPEKAQLGTLEIMCVQNECKPARSFEICTGKEMYFKTSKEVIVGLLNQK